MQTEVVFKKRALKFLKSAPAPIGKQILAAIERVRVHPNDKHDIKPMEGKASGLFRLRVGAYRVIFSVSENGEIKILTIQDIGSREDVYKAWN